MHPIVRVPMRAFVPVLSLGAPCLRHRDHSVPAPGYLFATLTASNATDPSSNNTGTGSTPRNGNGGSNPANGNTNTSLAMWAILLVASFLMY